MSEDLICGIVLKRPRLQYGREFTARVAIFQVGVKPRRPRRQIEPCDTLKYTKTWSKTFRL